MKGSTATAAAWLLGAAGFIPELPAWATAVLWMGATAVVGWWAIARVENAINKEKP